jgi:diguanylate cyclase (GGDEF)-like protein
MLLGLRKSGAETNQLLRGLGLGLSDVSGAGVRVLAQIVAERDALAARLEAAEAVADRDTLTPTFNRRAFMRELHRTMSEVERYKSQAAVLFIDLDGFKAVNDAYGHAAGDAVLKQLGRLLVDSVRESDVVGRLGGDEFGIILNRAPPDEARAKAASLGERVNAAAIVHAGITHRVRVSIGVHAIATVEDPELAVARADEAMYADKHARRARADKFGAF